MASELSMPALKSAANQHSDVVHELHDAASARGGRRENAKMTGGRDHSATSAMRGEDGLALRDNETRRDVWHGWSIGTDHGPFTLSDTGCVGPSALSGACSGQPQLASASGAPGRVRPQTPRAAPHQRPPRTTLRAMFRPEPSPKHRAFPGCGGTGQRPLRAAAGDSQVEEREKEAAPCAPSLGQIPACGR